MESHIAEGFGKQYAILTQWQAEANAEEKPFCITKMPLLALPKISINSRQIMLRYGGMYE